MFSFVVVNAEPRKVSLLANVFKIFQGWSPSLCQCLTLSCQQTFFLDSVLVKLNLRFATFC
jgi:hypothetical protein